MFSGGGDDNIAGFFRMYGGYLRDAVKGSTVTIASGYGAKFKRKVTMPRNVRQWARRYLPLAKNAAEERFMLLDLFELFEHEYGKVLDINDSPGISWWAAGVIAELDCVDEAWNATILLMWLRDHDLLQFHTVKSPMWKMSFTRWNHYAAIIQDSQGERWAIDGQYGKRPKIINTKRWYL